MKVYIFNTGFLKDRGKFDEFYEKLPEYVKKASANMSEKRKREFAAGKWLAEKALRSGGFFGEIIFNKKAKGKPYVLHGPEFNISHDGDFVVCACTENGVGVDVVSVERFLEGNFDRIFTEKEKKITENKVVKSALLWSLKEAYVKMTGEGLSTAGRLDFSGLLRNEKMLRGEFFEGVYFYSVCMCGYIVTLCTKQQEDVEFIFC